jgi:hypothetical protein
MSDTNLVKQSPFQDLKVLEKPSSKAKPEELPKITAGPPPGDIVRPRQRSAETTQSKKPKKDQSAAAPVDAFYDSERRLYLMRNNGQRWLAYTTDQFKPRLRSLGFRSKAIAGELIAPADRVLLRLQDNRDVRYAGPLAGRASGFYEENGARFLVTEDCRFLEPSPGEWPNLKIVLENLLTNGEPEHGQRQLRTFLTWLKGTIEALRAGKFKEAQALAIAGPVKSGKSLLQKLITPLLGGRECKPFGFMAGKTPFNAELFEAEHLALEDEHMSRRLSDRLQLGAAIKAVVANESHSCHRKYCTPITLRPFWRLTITLNDEPEALLVLPPLDDHVADKILLLRASHFPMPMCTVTPDDRAKFWDTLMTELPAFLDFLLNQYCSPAELRDSRYVVAGWHHPELASALHDLSPAAALLVLIDTLAPWGDSDEWEGTAEELRRDLFRNSDTAIDTKRLLEWPQSCGTYLGTLARKQPTRVRPHRTSELRNWIIRAPQNDAMTHE